MCVFVVMNSNKEDKKTEDAVCIMSFEEIYEEYASLVYRVILYHSVDSDTAEEIMQEVFMKLYINKENVNPKAIRAWLVTTARNMACNYKRDSWYETLLLDDLDDNNNGLLVMDSLEDDFMEALRDSGCSALVEKVFEDLYRKNVRWYEAVTIAYLLEKPQKEVAEIMGMTLEQLHGMLYRARKWIQEKYKEEYDRL